MLLSLVLQAAFWLNALRHLPLSIAYPFMSLVLPLNLLLSSVFFGEAIRAEHIAGIVVIATGVFIISLDGEGCK